MKIAHLNRFDGTQELDGAGFPHLTAAGFAKTIERPDLSGLASLELLELATREDAFVKWMFAILLEPSIPSI